MKTYRVRYIDLITNRKASRKYKANNATEALALFESDFENTLGIEFLEIEEV